jgi:hypothetical protein
VKDKDQTIIEQTMRNVADLQEKSAFNVSLPLLNREL